VPLADTGAVSVPPALADVMVTLGACDFPRLREIYRTLGWPQIIDDSGRSAYLCDPEDNCFEITWAEPTSSGSPR
jgi:hypothetical protein